MTSMSTGFLFQISVGPQAKADKSHQSKIWALLEVSKAQTWHLTAHAAAVRAMSAVPWQQLLPQENPKLSERAETDQPSQAGQPVGPTHPKPQLWQSVCMDFSSYWLTHLEFVYLY